MDYKISNEFFEIELKKPDGEVETVCYRKDKETFYGDYAIVKAFSKDPRFSRYTWYGIVNRDFETVVDFKIRNHMEWLSENYFIFSEKKFVRGREENITFTYQHDGDGFQKIDSFQNYRIVSFDVIVIEFLGCFYLYDIIKKKIISNAFDQIGEFQIIHGRMVAEAIRKLGESKKINDFYQREVEVICYIDISGEIVSPVYNPLTDQYENISREDFNGYVSDLRKRLPNHFDKNEVLLTLQKKVRKIQ